MPGLGVERAAAGCHVRLHDPKALQRGRCFGVAGLPDMFESAVCRRLRRFSNGVGRRCEVGIETTWSTLRHFPPVPVVQGSSTGSSSALPRTVWGTSVGKLSAKREFRHSCISVLCTRCTATCSHHLSSKAQLQKSTTPSLKTEMIGLSYKLYI